MLDVKKEIGTGEIRSETRQIPKRVKHASKSRSSKKRKLFDSPTVIELDEEVEVPAPQV